VNLIYPDSLFSRNQDDLNPVNNISELTKGKEDQRNIEEKLKHQGRLNLQDNLYTELNQDKLNRKEMKLNYNNINSNPELKLPEFPNSLLRRKNKNLTQQSNFQLISEDSKKQNSLLRIHHESRINNNNQNFGNFKGQFQYQENQENKKKTLFTEVEHNYVELIQNSNFVEMNLKGKPDNVNTGIQKYLNFILKSNK